LKEIEASSRDLVNDKSSNSTVVDASHAVAKSVDCASVYCYINVTL
jgi:hypothetical protein